MDMDQDSTIPVSVVLFSESSRGLPEMSVKNTYFCPKKDNCFNQLLRFVSSQPELKNSVFLKYNMKGKFVLPLPNSMPPGSKLIIVGTPPKNNPDRFSINLESCTDIALHLNPKFKEEVFVRNSRKNNKWGTEHRHGPFSFAPGVQFILQIESESKGFKISDEMAVTFFEHRLNPESIDVLRISGDVIIDEITFIIPSASNLPKEFSFGYIDMDNDMIPIESEAEFVECLKECKLLRGFGKTPALYVCEKGKEPENFQLTIEHINKTFVAKELGLDEDSNLNRPPEIGKCKTLNQQQSHSVDEVPRWFKTEIQKLKTELIESMEAKVFSEMSSVLDNFAKELHLALEKVTKEDEGKESKKSKEKKKAEKKAEKKEKAERKEKARLLSNASSVSKPIKDKQGKHTQAAGAYNMRFVDACISKLDKQSVCRDHHLQSHKRTSLNEEKRNKLYAATKRKKDCPLKHERRPLFTNTGKSNSNAEMKNKVHLFLDKDAGPSTEICRKKKDADRTHIKAKLFDTFETFSPSSSDSDHREGPEECDDIVVVGFSSSFDEISDSDLSLKNVGGLGAGVSGKESAVDVELPACFFPEVPIAFKGSNLPLRLKQTDVEELKTKASNNNVYCTQKESRSIDQENNAFIVDEKGICHSVDDLMEQELKDLEADLKEWQILNSHNPVWSPSSRSQAAESKESSSESKMQAPFEAPTPSTDKNHCLQKHYKVDFSREIDPEQFYQVPINNDPNMSGPGYVSKMSACSDKTGTDEKYDVDGGKSNAELRYASAGPKMTVSERLQSREPPHSDNASEKSQLKEPPHSDNAKERKRKKEAEIKGLIYLLYSLCQNPPTVPVSSTGNSKGVNEFELERSSVSNGAPVDPVFVKLNKTSTLKSEKKSIPSDYDDQFVLKSSNSSDDSSSFDYEECEETNKPKNCVESNQGSKKSGCKVSEPSDLVSTSVVSSHFIRDQSNATGKVISTDFTFEVNEDNSSRKEVSRLASQDNATRITEAPKSTAISSDGDNASQAIETAVEVTAFDGSDATTQYPSTGFVQANHRSFSGCPKFSVPIFSSSTEASPEVTFIGKKNLCDVAAGMDFDLLKSTKPSANQASHDSAASSYFNTSKNATYPPQQVHQSGATLNTSTPYNPFTGGAPYFSDLLQGQNGYTYVSYMPLPKNFSCSQSFQSSQSAQNLIPKPAVPPPPPIVIPPAPAHYYQPTYNNTLYTNSVDPYYTNPQCNAYLNKDPLKNCAPLKRDHTCTTPVMGQMYPSVYPPYYLPSTVPLNDAQSNWTTVMPPAAVPAANFVQSPPQTAGQPSNNLLQDSASGNDKLTSGVTQCKKKAFFSDASTSKNDVSSAINASCHKEPSLTNASTSLNPSAALNATISSNEVLTSEASPCGIEVSAPSAKPPARLNLADRLFSTLNSAASNVKEAFAPSRISNEGRALRDLCKSEDVSPEFLDAFSRKKPIQIHILHQSTGQRFFVMPHKYLGESHTLHCDLKSHMTLERPRSLTDSDLQSGAICALHENLHLARDNKDTWSRIIILSAEGSLVRAQKLDFGVIVHCDSLHLAELPAKFKSVPALAAQVVFSELKGPLENILGQMNPLYIQPLQYFHEDNYWLVKVCDNVQESLNLDADIASTSSTPTSNTGTTRNQRSATSHFSSVEGTPVTFENTPLNSRGQTAVHEQLDQSLEDKVKFLQDIGFKGEAELKNLLITYDGDMSDVIDYVTSNGGYFFSPPEENWR